MKSEEEIKKELDKEIVSYSSNISNAYSHSRYYVMGMLDALAWVLELGDGTPKGAFDAVRELIKDDRDTRTPTT